MTSSLLRTALCIALVLPATAAAQPVLLELTFDDGPDGSGPAEGRADLNNLEGRSPLSAVLRGAAHRSRIDEGRYGRAAVFGGGADHIELVSSAPLSAPYLNLLMWLRPDAAEGHLLGQAGSWSIGLSAGELVFNVVGGDAGVTMIPFGVSVPMDGAFHHLEVQIDPAGQQASALLGFNPQDRRTVALASLPPQSTQPLRIGVDYRGRIDELLLSRQPAAPAETAFNRDPQACASGVVCREDVIQLLPVPVDATSGRYTWPVPVRLKTGYDPAQCTPSTPCPLLVTISGGFTCADDYDGPGAFGTFARAGAVVVTIDPYCEADGFYAPIWEPAQYIAVKNWVLASSPLRDRITPGDYFASGCSHGAGTTLAWALKETDHPARTFSRSPSVEVHCAYHGVEMCTEYKTAIDQVIASYLGQSTVAPHDDSNPAVQTFWGLNAIDYPSLVNTREVAISWGADLTPSTPICSANGTAQCFEEGAGTAPGARAFRDRWRSLEDPNRPTGYFVEDHESDCRHCASPNGQVFACGACFLLRGRAGMQSACPSCLQLSEGAASTCVDPFVQDAGTADAGHDDAGIADAGTSAAADADAGVPDEDTPRPGCGCQASGAASAGTLAFLLLTLLAMAVALRTQNRL
ncbi:MAG: hypothetical protein ACOZIN_04875 [Myxococcota bacterium]